MPVMPEPPPTDYRILVCHARRGRDARLTTFPYTSPIPPIPIPLLPGDHEPMLDLNGVLHALIERAGYDLVIDYTQPPDPPLRPADEAWAAAIVAGTIEARRRESSKRGSNAMNCQDRFYRHADRHLVNRRWFLEQCGVGLGAIALGDMLKADGYAAASENPAADRPLTPKAPHHPAKAKRVLFLFMAGAPSHLEMFDNKPQLAKFDGTLPPPELIQGYRAAFIKPNSKLLGPKFKFARHGQCGTELSELLPHMANVVDDIAVVKGMVTDAFNHAPGQILMSTGSPIFGRPELRLLDVLRAGKRVRGPARLHRLQHRKERAEWRQFQLGKRVLADRLPGRAVPQQRRPRALSVQSPRDRRCAPARLARRRSKVESRTAGSSQATPRLRRASTLTRWPSACSRARRE